MNKKKIERIRKGMRANKSKGTKIELILLKALWQKGYRYRKNNNKIFGKPDVSFSKYKIALFVDGEFWHGKDFEKRKYDHKNNIPFWHNKILKNISRDKIVNNHLTNNGWKVLRFWGNDIKTNLNNCIELIENEIKNVIHKNIKKQ